MKTLSNVQFLNGGYCCQFEWLAGVRSWKVRRFYAVFVRFDHPEHGPCLIDCGYGPENYRSGKNWPWRILQWLLPIPKKQSFINKDYFSEQKLAPEIPYNLFLSHFHPDHIGGLSLFPKAKLIFRESVFRKLASMTRMQQLHQGFIPSLMPSDVSDRTVPIDEEQFQLGPLARYGLKTLDYFQDGTLTVIDLPGHAMGHSGYLLNTTVGSILYVVDAFWDVRAFWSNRNLPWLSRRTAYDWEAYHRTQQRIWEWAAVESLTPLGCHCPETQKYVWVKH